MGFISFFIIIFSSTKIAVETTSKIIVYIIKQQYTLKLWISS